MPSIFDNFTERQIIYIKPLLAVVFGVIAWLLASLLGIEGANIAQWAGPDKILTVGEVLGGLTAVLTGYFGADAVKAAKQG